VDHADPVLIVVIAGPYTGSGYRSVFVSSAGTWVVGALVLAVFGPATRRRRPAEEAVQPAPVEA
jgi:putative MFS transporter